MDRWAHVKRIHQAALDREGPERAAFLDQACGDDLALRQEVESLLTYRVAAEPFMEVPALEVAARSLGRDAAPSLIGRTLGHYDVRALLGAGGMGEVYLAYDPRLERPVALKVLAPHCAFDAHSLRQFVDETRAASALNHPNVATIYDVGETGGVHFIVMEYVEGDTIAARIAAQALGAAEVLDIAVQVADALDAAHAKGIIHRDIKPANLMLTLHGRLKVLDFGIARTIKTRDATASPTGGVGQTAGSIVVGSLPYMSPEHLQGRETDPRSDLFSLGVTLYELATRQLPFTGTTAVETRERILQGQPAPMCGIAEDIPPEFERIALKCLEKDAARRYQSARELLADLRHLKRQTDGLLPPVEAGVRTNIPAALTSFVGRRRELDDIRSVLRTSRLLTLTGAGGCGKTRLAVQVASQLLDEFPDGVWVVDLGPLSEPALIPHTIAAAVGVREGANRSTTEALANYFRGRRVLLVLDNCEHLIAACAGIAEQLLHAAPRVHLLATSREGLGIQGETIWRVPSLSMPDAAVDPAPSSLVEFEAVRLFVDRARALQPGFSVTDTSAATVADICRRLDGIPLALELAAARLTVLSIDQIGARLNDRFRLLTGGSRTAVARQRTLEATIDWSYDLLSDDERTLLCRLTVFPGGWTVEAAERVCAGDGITPEATLDLLARLVHKSLVNVEDDPAGNRRYRCLETVRQYGRERLLRSGDAERVRAAHLEFFFALAREAEPGLMGADQAAWLNRLQIEHDNLRSAMAWCLDTHAGDDRAAQMAVALYWFWIKRGYLGEGRRWVEQALATPGLSTRLSTRALNGLAALTFFGGDYEATQAASERSLALARDAGDPQEEIWSLSVQALVALESGDMERSARLAHQSRDLAAATGELWRQGPAFSCLAYQAMQVGDGERACELAGEVLASSRRMGDAWGTAICLSDIALFRLLQGRYAEAERLCAEALNVAAPLSDRLLCSFFLSILAGAQAGQDRYVRAGRLWGATHMLLDCVGAPLQPSHKTYVGDRFITAAEAALGRAAFQAALDEGRAMSFRQAVEYALASAS